MNTENQKNSIKKILSLIGMAGTGALLTFPLLANIDSSSNRYVLAQIVPGNTPQNPVTTNTNQQFLGNPVPQNPIRTNTNQQFLGNPNQQNPIRTNTNQQFRGSPVLPISPLGTNRNQQFPTGTNTTQPPTQRSGM